MALIVTNDFTLTLRRERRRNKEIGSEKRFISTQTIKWGGDGGEITTNLR